MKYRFIYTLSSLVFVTLLTACSGQMADKMAEVGTPSLSSDPCAAIDAKVLRLDRFTQVVQNTSAFHLEEKAAALTVPGITVSTNRKKMLQDAEKKYAEYTAERQKYSCKTPVPVRTADIAYQKEVVNKPVPVSEPSTSSDQKMMKAEALTTKVIPTHTVKVEEKAAAVPLPAMKVKANNAQELSEETKKETAPLAEHQKERTQIADQKAVRGNSDVCDALNNELIELYEFTIMVNNTSAFHLEEKLQAMPVPGITVSSNKKKMLRDAEKKRVELLVERQKQGCETAEKE